MEKRDRMSWPFRASVSVAILFVMISCIVATGCLDTVILPVFTNTGHTHLADNEGKVSVYFFDVGQGDSTLFAVDGKTILIDAGEIGMGDRVVGNLKALGVTRIDLLVATHPHSDHVGGMQEVLAAFPVGQVLDSGMPHTSSTYEHFLETVDQKNIPYRVAQQGQTIVFDPAVRVFVLSPPAHQIPDDINGNSIVLRISYGTIDFLMTGDLEAEGEDALIHSGYPIDAEILKIGHHGSSSSTSPAVIARVRPELGVITAGVGNPYGHPHQETLRLLKESRVRVYRTDRDGTIVIRTDGLSYSVKTETDYAGIWNATPTRKIIPATPVFTLPALPTIEHVPLPSITLSPVLENFTISVPLPTFPQIGNASSISFGATQFDAPGDDRLNLNGEWVQIHNTGNDTVFIAGWTLTDKGQNTRYSFPAIYLVPGESITIYSGRGEMNNTALFMGKTEPVWGNNGDTAVLKDGRGTVIGTASEGVSS